MTDEMTYEDLEEDLAGKPPGDGEIPDSDNRAGEMLRWWRSATRRLDHLNDMYEAEQVRIEERRLEHTKNLAERVEQLETGLEAFHQARIAEAEAEGRKIPASIKLPTGTLTSRAGRKVIDIADGELETVARWLIDNDHADTVKVTPRLSEMMTLVKTDILAVDDAGRLVSQDGEIVPGASLQQKPRSFGVKR